MNGNSRTIVVDWLVPKVTPVRVNGTVSWSVDALCQNATAAVNVTTDISMSWEEIVDICRRMLRVYTQMELPVENDDIKVFLLQDGYHVEFRLHAVDAALSVMVDELSQQMSQYTNQIIITGNRKVPARRIETAEAHRLTLAAMVANGNVSLVHVVSRYVFPMERRTL